MSRATFWQNLHGAGHFSHPALPFGYEIFRDGKHLRPFSVLWKLSCTKSQRSDIARGNVALYINLTKRRN